MIAREGRSMRATLLDEGWDRRLVKIWATVLLLLLFWPRSCTPETTFAWDEISRIDDLDPQIRQQLGISKLRLAATALMPHVLGLGALLALFSGSSKLRGAIYVVLALLTLGITFESLDRMAGGLTTESDAIGRAVLIGLCIWIGPALIAGGNRVQRREGRGIATIAAGFGGVLLFAGFFVPMFRDQALVEIFSEDALWDSAWYLLLWLLVVMAYGLAGASVLLPGGERRGRLVSLLGRAVAVGLAVVGGAFWLDMPDAELAPVVSGFGMVFGIVILMAIGIALLLERPKYRVVGHEAAF